MSQQSKTRSSSYLFLISGSLWNTFHYVLTKTCEVGWERIGDYTDTYQSDADETGVM